MDNPKVTPYESVGTSPIPYYLVLTGVIIAVIYFYGITFDD